MKALLVLRLGAVGLLLWALRRNPYGYYQLLRFYICALGAVLGYLSVVTRQQVWAVVFIVLAVLFNPLIPVYLSRRTWAPIDAISAGIFLASVFLLRVEWPPRDSAQE